VERNGGLYLQFSDPQRISRHILFVPQPLAMLLAFCDGERTVSDAVSAYTRYYGAAMNGFSLTNKLVEELFSALDEAVMLENERSRQAYLSAVTAYRQAPARLPASAGNAYAANPKTLWQQLQSYLEGVDVISAPIDWSKPVGLLSPHIDYGRGGPVYAQVWKRATQAAREADLVIMIGTDHYGDDPFTLTRQNYATPYGTLPTSQAIVDSLVEVLGEEAAFAGELRHRGEHSLELVAVWLHHMRLGRPCETVPILCGSLQPFTVMHDSPAQHPQLTAVINVLRSAMAGRRTLIIASGDLAHVGPAFGGDPLNENGRSHIQQADESLIDHMEQGNADAFYHSIRSTQNHNNVCGVSPIYLTMKALGEPPGQPVGYAICPADGQNTSIVSVCGIFFH
jgi:hypothetical protein